MRVLKKIILWVAFLGAIGTLLFVNWVAIFFSTGEGKYALILFIIDITAAYFMMKYMGWLPENYHCPECGCSLFNAADNGDFVCDRCGKPHTQENE